MRLSNVYNVSEPHEIPIMTVITPTVSQNLLQHTNDCYPVRCQVSFERAFKFQFFKSVYVHFVLVYRYCDKNA